MEGHLPSVPLSSVTTAAPMTTTATAALALGSAPLPGPVDCRAVYHSLAGAQLPAWPALGQRTLMDPATAKRLATPLHVVTSLGKGFPVSPVPYPPPGGGLLKIATRTSGTATSGPGTAPATRPTAARRSPPSGTAEPRRATHAQRPRQTSSASCPGIAVATPSVGATGYPILPVASIASGEALKRPPLEETPRNAVWPQLMPRKKLRTTFSREQVDAMESSFQTSMYLTVAKRKQLAQRLDLEETKVKTWFQNRRMRYKRKHPDEYIAPRRAPCRPCQSTAVETTYRPLATTAPGHFLAPTPPPSCSASSAVTVLPLRRTHHPEELTTTTTTCCHQLQQQLLPPSPAYNLGMAPSAAAWHEGGGCGGALTMPTAFGAPVFPPMATGLDAHPTWVTTNVIGPHGGAHIPPRHI